MAMLGASLHISDSIIMIFALVIKRGNGKSPKQINMEVAMGQSSMNCGFSIAMFDCRRVLVKFNPYFCWQNPDFVCFNYDFRIFSLTQSRLFSPAFVGPQRWALLQVLLSDPLYLPSGAVPTILPWDPAGFVGELQPTHQEDLWDREDVTHGRVALSLGKKDLDGVSSSVFFF